MFARHVTMQLKPSRAREFPVAFEKEIVPLLQKQRGFVDALLLVVPATLESVAISLWESQECAQIYHRDLYPTVEKIVEKFIEGVPFIQNSEAKYATFLESSVPATV